MKSMKFAKFLMVVAITLVVGFFVTGIVQTIKLKDLENRINAVNYNNTEIEQKLEQAQDEIDFKESEEYKEEYFHGEGQVKEDEEIYK